MILDALVDCDKFAPAILKYRYQPTTRDVQHYRYDSLKSINSLLLGMLVCAHLFVSICTESLLFNRSLNLLTVNEKVNFFMLSETKQLLVFNPFSVDGLHFPSDNLKMANQFISHWTQIFYKIYFWRQVCWILPKNWLTVYT